MNFFVTISCLLALSASARAGGALGLEGLGVNGGLGGLGGYDGLVYAPGHASADYYSYPSYAFEYAVKDAQTGDNKAQWEKRDGDVVKGAYSLVEPDGSLRVVEYWADDKSGFNAVVKRVGPNLHPTIVKEAPIYKAEIPILGNDLGLGPISVGSIAKYGGLANAPLISGPIHGGAVSSANIYKEELPAYKPIAPIAPIIPAPVLKSLPAPIYNAGPIVEGPWLKEPLALKQNYGGLGYGGNIGLIKENIGYGGHIGLKGPLAYGGNVGLIKENIGYGGNLGLVKENLGYGGNLGLVKENLGYGGSLGLIKENIGYGGNIGLIKEPLGYAGNVGLIKEPYGYGGNVGLIKEPITSLGLLNGYYKQPVIKEPLGLGYGYGEGLVKAPLVGPAYDGIGYGEGLGKLGGGWNGWGAGGLGYKH